MRPFFKRTLSALTSCLLGVGVILSALQNVPFEVIAANDCIIDSSTTYQTIRGFGGMNHPEWAGDLTESQRETAFGNGADQLGLTVCRVFVNSDSSAWSRALATAKAAQAKGATVFASPWNPPDSMCETFTKSGDADAKRLKKSSYAAYAQHLNNFVKYMKDNGVNLACISIQNEPDWGFDWTWWTEDECVDFLANYADQIDCPVMSPESFSYRKSYYEKILANSKANANTDYWGTHFYGTSRANMDFPVLENDNREIWMTEVYTDSKQDADVYPLALDTRVNSSLTWLNGWTKTANIVTTSNDVTLELFKKAVKKGDTVTIGTNGASEASANLLVFAITGADEFILGDVNGDKIINGADMSLAKQIAIGKKQYTAAADVDQSGKVDTDDIAWYVDFLLAKTDKYPEAKVVVPPIDLSQYASTFASLNLAKSYKAENEHNPLITQYFGADPGVMEYDGRIYIYMTDDHLEYSNGEVTNNTYSKINCLRVISSADMVNWTDHGLINVAGSNGIAKWAGCSWAPTACHKKIDGKEKFFLYFANNANGIGVLTADSPIGPWSDPNGKALIDRRTTNCTDIPWVFDPAVLVDDDGTGYLYFGGGVPEINGTKQSANPKSARVVKLGANMTSLAGDPQLIDAPYIFEDSGINKIDGKYYYSYCSNWSTGGNPYGMNAASIEYMVSDSPMGPYTYAGEVFQNIGKFFGTTGNNHHTIMQFKGQFYLFYHAQYLQDQMGIEGGYRSTHIDELSYQDGKFGSVIGTKTGVSQLEPINAFETVQAETFSHQGGVTISGSGNTTVVGKAGSWIGVTGADCGNAKTITIRASSASGAKIGIFTGSASGKMVSCVEVPAGGNMQDISAAVVGLTGTQNLFFVCSGDVQIDTWMLK